MPAAYHLTERTFNLRHSRSIEPQDMAKSCINKPWNLCSLSTDGMIQRFDTCLKFGHLAKHLASPSFRRIASISFATTPSFTNRTACPTAPRSPPPVAQATSRLQIQTAQRSHSAVPAEPPWPTSPSPVQP